MVLLEIDADSIPGIEFEGDAPRAIDVHRVAGGDRALQGVKIKTWKVHLFWRGDGVQSVKTNHDALMHPCVDFCRTAS